ncbi:MAG: NAD(P)-dependent glycerol-3-phosphate dehydrogenase [Siculibacillus sp.]|nr:NAD(P)-dependent glycerol-3-phosphate dehydrogenase [Siculibacillus sp.]
MTDPIPVPAITTVAVLGAGAWGTALALVAARAGRTVRLWSRDPETVAEIGDRGTNSAFLGDIRLDPGLFATTDAATALAGADMVILAVPAQASREVAREFAHLVPKGIPVVSAAKGLEHGTHATMTGIIAEELPGTIPAVLSGPSFATDVARRLPTAVTVAAADDAVAARICRALSSSSFRPYATHDLVGVEIGGALKNVLAIASGIVAGRGLGASAQAALTARGFAELTRLGRALGAEPETMMGLSGLGDLVLTATSPQSRNFSLGLAIGAGGSVADLTRHGTKLAEGAHTASVAVEFAAMHGVELPVTAAVADLVSERIDVAGAIDRLMSRPLKRETA